MFTNLSLSNFQCHKSLSIPLGKITTLVGPSDSGKTAILRSLDWLCFNFGRVALLQRRGADYVSVTLEVDGHKITRSSQNNSYQVDEQLFKTINKTIPPEVSSILHVSEDNVQRQHDYLFWFTASGSVLVSNLNRVVDLSKLEDWVHIGVNKERACKDEVTYHTTRKTELEQNISNLVCYRDMDSDLTVIESLFGGLNGQKQKLTDLDRCLAELERLDLRKSKCEDYIIDLRSIIAYYDEICGKRGIIGKISELLEKYRNLDEKVKLYEELCAIPLDCDEILEKRERVTALEKDLCRIDVLDNVLVEFSDVSKLYSECCALEKSTDRLSSLTDVLIGIGSLSSSIDKADLNVNSIRKEIEEKSEGRCPICGGVLSLENSCG